MPSDRDRALEAWQKICPIHDWRYTDYADAIADAFLEFAASELTYGPVICTERAAELRSQKSTKDKPDGGQRP